VVADYAEGARRFGASEFRRFRPDAEASPRYDEPYRRYGELSRNSGVRALMHGLAG
jgi:hypothetical protein